MAGSVVVSLVWVILVITIWFIVLNSLVYIFWDGGFGSFLSFWFDYINQLFGSDYWYAFACMVLCVLLIMLFRFLISWITEDSGSSANS